MKKIITIFVLTLTVLSCTKVRPVVPNDYVGNWKCNDKTIGGINIYYYITIHSSGIGSYQKDGLIENTKISGDVSIEGSALKIKNTTFSIDQAPRLCEGSTSKWEMTISGLTYMR